MIVDVETQSWDCVSNEGGLRHCPGAFNLECPETPLVPSVEECSEQCDRSHGQLLVSPDCKEAFICWSGMAQGGRIFECPEGTVVGVDTIKLEMLKLC